MTAFVERWHADTSSFHLPFGEMTITLHDICNLLHLPILGNFPTAEEVSGERAVALAQQYLGVTYQDARANTIAGPYYRFGWLQEILERHSGEGGDEDIALRAYLLLLLSYSIFTCKTSNRADAKFLLLLADLETCGSWAWGVGALVHLYMELRFSSIWNTSQLSGFPGLLQAWIMWYFPRVWERKAGAVVGQALGGHWTKKKTNQKVVECRRIVDRLTLADVCWQPFEGHEHAIPLEQFSLYRGWLTWGDQTAPYMPDRCIRQFGYVQPIPRSPLRPPYPDHDDLMRSIIEFVPIVSQIIESATVWSYPGEVADGYLRWYAEHSYPRLMVADMDEDDADEDEGGHEGGHEGGDEDVEYPPADGAPVPEHLPGWVHLMVSRLRQALRSGGIRQAHYQGLYELVGFPQDPPPPDRPGPRGHRRRQP